MRRPLTIVAVSLLAGVAAVTAATAGAPQTGAIRGNVFDLTCYGPCTAEQEPAPFAGPGKVVVRDLVAGERAATHRFHGPTWGIGIDPGTYRVRVIPYPADEGPQRCWSGSKRRVVVAPDEAEVVRLTVANDCVLREALSTPP